MKKERNVFWDVVKGVAILLVVLGHSINYGNGADYLRSEAFYDLFLFKLIYSFHMPIFMVVSGYLFYNSVLCKSPSIIILSRIRMLLIPVVSFAVIYKCPALFSVFKGEMSLLSFAYDFFTTVFLGYHLWFLWSVFLNSMLVLLVQKLKFSSYTYILIWICSLLLRSSGDFLSGMELYSFMFPYFVIGFMFHQYGNTKWYSSGRVLIISALLYAVLLLFFDRETYIYTSGQCILRDNGLHYLLIDVQRFLTGLFGSIFFINAIRALYINFDKMSIFKYLSILGINSMGIYCFHHIFLWQFIKHCTIHIHINYFNLPLTLLTFVPTLTFGLVCTFLAKKYRITNVLFLGGR